VCSSDLAATCDVNGDGRGDVLDLVEMVHCILGGGPCADTVAARFLPLEVNYPALGRWLARVAAITPAAATEPGR
jgi:hypothetical protein